MAIRAKLTTLEDTTAQKAAAAAAAAKGGERTEEEKAQRKDRVAKAKDALARSITLKGDHVPPARTALKTYLQHLNEPRQPDDSTFEAMVEAPFKVPPKKKTNNRRF